MGMQLQYGEWLHDCKIGLIKSKFVLIPEWENSEYICLIQPLIWLVFTDEATDDGRYSTENEKQTINTFPHICLISQGAEKFYSYQDDSEL